jgi:hypothetical protein
MKLPRWLVNVISLRFTIRTLALFVACIAVALWLIMRFLPPVDARYLYYKELHFDFQVTDADSGGAIAGAMCTFRHDGLMQGLFAAGKTDSNGQADFDWEIGLSHRPGLLGPVAVYVFDPWFVEVFANGYEPLEVPLSDYTGPNCDSRSYANPVIRLALKKKPLNMTELDEKIARVKATLLRNVQRNMDQAEQKRGAPPRLSWPWGQPPN